MDPEIPSLIYIKRQQRVSHWPGIKEDEIFVGVVRRTRSGIYEYVLPDGRVTGEAGTYEDAIIGLVVATIRESSE